MQKLGGFPVNSKLTVSTINVFFAAMEYRYSYSVVHTGMAIHTVALSAFLASIVDRFNLFAGFLTGGLVCKSLGGFL